MARHFLPNTGFELGDRDWLPETGFSVVNDLANARSGAWVGKLVEAGTAHALLPAVDVRPGVKINASIWIKGGSSGDGMVSATWLDEDGVAFAFSNGNLIGFGGVSYAESSAEFVAGNKAKSVQLGARVINSTGTWFVDDLEASGDIIEAIPASAKISNHTFVPSRTQGAFRPLNSSPKFTEFNSGKSDKWVGTYTFIPLHPDGDLGELLGFLERLGQIDKFFAFDPDRRVPKNGVVDGMVVDGFPQVGNSLAVRGGPVNTTALVAGDYFEVRDQYCQLLRDLEIGPEGTGTAVFYPALRTSPADGEPIVTDNPAMVARITSEIPRRSDSTKWTELTVSWEEV